MWQHRKKPTDLGWTILVLFPKGNTNIRRIDLLETLWNVIDSIIDAHLRESMDGNGDGHPGDQTCSGDS